MHDLEMSLGAWEPGDLRPQLGFLYLLLIFSYKLVGNLNSMITSCSSQHCIHGICSWGLVYIYPVERGGTGVCINILTDLLTSVVFSLFN